MKVAITTKHSFSLSIEALWRMAEYGCEWAKAHKEHPILAKNVTNVTKIGEFSKMYREWFTGKSKPKL